ncbi:MAG: hypothetical protein IPI46_00805 [Bacteroidetes bacterium]|nr:hypothetical protein [Bacteroidota bacterium]
MKKILFILMFVIEVNGLFAQISSWNHTHYTTKDGLPSNIIRNMVQDHDGFLWIVTECGLCRFDGDEFIRVLHDDKDSTTIPTDHLNFIALSPNGHLLVSTSLGIFVMNPKTMRGYTIHARLTKERINLDDNFRNIYVNTALRKIFVITSTALIVMDYSMKILSTIPYPFPKNDLLKVSFTHYAPLFLSNGDVIFHDNYNPRLGLIDFQSKKFVSLSDFPAHPYFALSKVSNADCSAIDSSGNIWLHLSGKDTLYCCPPFKPLVKYPLKGKAKLIGWPGRISFPNSKKMVWAFMEKDNAILYELPYEYLLKNKGCEVSVDIHSGFSASDYHAFTDKTGNMWFGSSNGLFLVKSNRHSLDKIQLPLPYKFNYEWQYVSDISPFDENHILITTNREHCFLYDLAHNQMQSYLDTVGYQQNWNYSMYRIVPLENKRSLIIGDQVFVFQNDQLILHPTFKNAFEELFATYNFTSFFKDRNGNSWVSFKNYGLVRWDASKHDLKLFKPHGDFCSDDFTAITEDKEGAIWFVNNAQSTLWKFNSFTSKFDSPQIHLPFKWIRHIVAGEKNILYIAALDGLLIYDTKSHGYRKINMIDGLPSNVIKGLFYYQNHLFISSKNGLGIMNTKDYSLRVLHQNDGIEEDITTKAYLLDTVNNLLYIGGKACVYKVNLPSLFEKGFQPTILLEKCTINGNAFYAADKDIILSSDQNNISFSVSSIDFYSGFNKNYYYRIILNGDTSQWKSNNRLKQFSFLNMASGNYRIEVKSSNAHNLWSNNTASLNFQILSPWYNRWWFYLLSICALAMVLYLLYDYRIRQIRKIDSFRNKLSRDLHDDIGSTLSSINILSRTAQRSAQQVGDEKTNSSLHKINERSQRLLSNMSDIIWNINPSNDSVDEMMSRIREYATTLMEAKEIDCKFNFTAKKTLKLPMNIKSNLYLICKEAINNLSKYSDCTQAIISLAVDEKLILLSVEDNGNGFDLEKVTHMGGLRNMQHRANEMNGILNIHSDIGKGTKVNLTIRF